MQVEFHANGWGISNDSDIHQTKEIQGVLQKELNSGSEFAKNHNFDNPGLMAFKNYLSEKKIKIEGENSQEILQALDNEVKKFNSSTVILRGLAGGYTEGAAGIGILLAAAHGAGAISGMGVDPDTNYALQIINQSSSAPKVFFPDRLPNISSEDRANPQRIRETLGDNIRQDKNGEYFTIIFRDPGRKAPSVEKYHLNNPEQLKEAFRIIDAEKTRRENSTAKSV